MNVGIVYPTALFDRGTVESWGEFYERILGRIIVDPAEEWTTLPEVLQKL
ncbi:hypothetical protein [Rhodococcus sp. P1Y]|nr:hypothetical protein [Rhodococcus sp. P1Y]